MASSWPRHMLILHTFVFYGLLGLAWGQQVALFCRIFNAYGMSPGYALSPPVTPHILHNRTAPLTDVPVSFPLCSLTAWQIVPSLRQIACKLCFGHMHTLWCTNESVERTQITRIHAKETCNSSDLSWLSNSLLLLSRTVYLATSSFMFQVSLCLEFVPSLSFSHMHVHEAHLIISGHQTSAVARSQRMYVPTHWRRRRLSCCSQPRTVARPKRRSMRMGPFPFYTLPEHERFARVRLNVIALHGTYSQCCVRTHLCTYVYNF